MKKFLIGCLIVVLVVASTIISLACVTKKYDFNYQSATNIMLFAKDAQAIEKDGINKFEKDSGVYKKTMQLIDKSLTANLLTLVATGRANNFVVEQDLSNKAPLYSGTTKDTNYCIELEYSAPLPNQIVYYEGNSKMVCKNGYAGLIFVLGSTKGYNKVYIYYKEKTGEIISDYKPYPMVMYFDNSQIVDYLEKLK